MTRAHQRRIWPALGVAAAAGGSGWLLGRPELFGARSGFVAAFVCLGVLPAALTQGTLKVKVTALGLRTGNRKTGALLLMPGLPIAVLAGFLGAGVSELALEYPLDQTLTRTWSEFFPHAMFYLLYYVGFEFLFRGYVLLGLRDRIGSHKANLLQSVLATLYHVGKPLAEIGAAFPASLLFGAVALHTRSIWYVVAVHWVIGISLDWFLVR